MAYALLLPEDDDVGDAELVSTGTGSVLTALLDWSLASDSSVSTTFGCTISSAAAEEEEDEEDEVDDGELSVAPSAAAGGGCVRSPVRCTAQKPPFLARAEHHERLQRRPPPWL